MKDEKYYVEFTEEVAKMLKLKCSDEKLNYIKLKYNSSIMYYGYYSFPYKIVINVPLIIKTVTEDGKKFKHDEYTIDQLIKSKIIYVVVHEMHHLAQHVPYNYQGLIKPRFETPTHKMTYNYIDALRYTIESTLKIDADILKQETIRHGFCCSMSHYKFKFASNYSILKRFLYEYDLNAYKALKAIEPETMGKNYHKSFIHMEYNGKIYKIKSGGKWNRDFNFLIRDYMDDIWSSKWAGGKERSPITISSAKVKEYKQYKSSYKVIV